MIYRFKQAIRLSNGKILGNNDPKKGPLGGECFFDTAEDNLIQNEVKAHCAKEAEAAQPKKKKD